MLWLDRGGRRRPGPLGSMTWFSKAVKTLGKAPSKEWPSLGLRSGRSPGQLSVIIKLRKGCLSRRQSHPSPASFLLRDPRRDTHPAPHAHRGQTERPRASSQLAGFLPAGSPCPVSHPHTCDTGGDSCSHRAADGREPSRFKCAAPTPRPALPPRSSRWFSAIAGV